MCGVAFCWAFLARWFVFRAGWGWGAGIIFCCFLFLQKAVRSGRASRPLECLRLSCNNNTSLNRIVIFCITLCLCEEKLSDPNILVLEHMSVSRHGRKED